MRQAGEEQQLAIQDQHGRVDRIEQLHHLFQGELDRCLVATTGGDYRLQVVGARLARFDGKHLRDFASRLIHASHVDQQPDPGDARVEILRIQGGRLGVGRQGAREVALDMENGRPRIPGHGIVRRQADRLVGYGRRPAKITRTNVKRRLRQTHRYRTRIENACFLQRC